MRSEVLRIARQPLARKWPHPDRLGWAALIAALITTWIDFGRLHEFLNSDSFMPVLLSLMRWTPFIWEQDHWGMLIPLLASPIHSPFANLLVEAWLATFVGVFANFLLLRYVLGNGSTWLTAGLISMLTALYVCPLWMQCDWFVNEMYGTSLTLALSAFILLESASVLRWTLAIILMLLAYWVNVALFTLLIPLVLFHYLLERRQSDLTRLLPCASLGALAGFLMQRTSPYHTPAGVAPLSEWPNAWAHLFRAAYQMVPNPFQLLWLIIPAAGAVLVLLLRPTGEEKHLFQAAAVLGGVGLMNWLFVGTLIWVHLNAYHPRYTYSALLFAMAALAVLEGQALEMTLGNRRGLIILAILMFVAMGYRYGRPSIAQVRRTLDQHFGYMTDDILNAQATVVAGDFWKVWLAVFHANMVLYERGEQWKVYGLTGRSSVTGPLWADIPPDQLCVATPVGDVKAGKYMDRMDIHLAQVDHRKTVDVFRHSPDSSCRRSSKTELPAEWLDLHFREYFSSLWRRG